MSVKHLWLLRHAKSSWKFPELDDHDRPLNKRGLRDAPRMGDALSALHRPTVFHVSSARRTQATFDGLCRGWDGLSACHAVTEPALYTFNADRLLAWLRNQSGSSDPTVLALIGHNPALTELINRLAPAAALANLPTAGWAELCLPISQWKDIDLALGNSDLTRLMQPKRLALQELN